MRSRKFQSGSTIHHSSQNFSSTERASPTTQASFLINKLFHTRFCFQQLEKELMERQPQVNALQEISDTLLMKGRGEDYIEAEEKVHVIEKKLKQLLDQVSQDLLSLQGSQVSPLWLLNIKLSHSMQMGKECCSLAVGGRPEARPPSGVSSQTLSSCVALENTQAL